MPEDTSKKPASQPSQRFPGGMSPGDEAPAGTPGTGEVDGAACQDCAGSGYVIGGIGGA